MKKNILILAIGFLPNIGGLETHLKDLIDELIKKNWRVTVLTYQPLHTPTLGKWKEVSTNLVIYRLPSFRGLFYKFLKIPILEFLFLEPLLFIVTPLILLMNPKISIVNAQGVIAGFSASFWTKIFRKKYVAAVQSIYGFPKEGLYKDICSWIFKSADKVIAISNQAKKEVEGLGVKVGKIIVYTNWENAKNYRALNKQDSKKKLNLENKFVVSFFGRLVEEKGILVLLEAVGNCDPEITFLIYGEGPLLDKVKAAEQEFSNIKYMGIVSPKDLSLHYSAADLVLMPSLHEEGFGRVAAGALMCGTPVIASNRGALPQVVNSSVGKIIEPAKKEISKAINYYFKNQNNLKNITANTRKYALSKFSSSNSSVIINSFKD